MGSTGFLCDVSVLRSTCYVPKSPSPSLCPRLCRRRFSHAATSLVVWLSGLLVEKVREIVLNNWESGVGMELAEGSCFHRMVFFLIFACPSTAISKMYDSALDISPTLFQNQLP